jgi:hypothetical protein
MSSTPGGAEKPASDREPASPREPIEQRPRSRRPFLVCAAILTAVGLLGLRERLRIVDDPETYFLLDEAGGSWIRADAPCLLGARSSSQTVTVFECRFTTARLLQNARLTVRAFRRCLVEMDNKPVDARPTGSEAAGGTLPSRGRQNEARERLARQKADSPDAWKEPKEFVVPGPLAPGTHQLRISVFNFNAHPCVWASSNELGLQTGADWFVVESNGKRTPAVSAAHVRMPEEALLYPTVKEAFLSRWPWLAATFVLVFAWTVWTSRPARSAERGACWQLTPSRVRWILLTAWVVLAANNIWQIPNWVGPDLVPHLNYVFYLSEHRSLPLATDGFEMFQAPLFYLLAAPWYGLLAPHVSAIAIVKILRFLPLLCGLAQIEIVYRTSRVVFPEKRDLQILATTIGGLMPMNIYSSQVLGNEPLAGCLTALLMLLSVSLLVEPLRNRSLWFFAVMGLVWGLAILSKVTPLLLAPLLIGVIAVHCRNVGGAWRQTLVRGSLVFGTCFFTAGWWFLRNWARLGTPIATSQTRGNVWWQDPSYRTVPQLTSFGVSLSRPIYGGVWSLWDTFYSSLWLDGNVSGLVIPPKVFHWNVDWMLAGAWLAVVPMALLCLSPAACLRRELRPARDALLFCLAALAVYLAAIVDLYIGLPVLSTAKATYTMGLLPCYGLLVAAGAAPLLRGRFLRAVLFSAIACWALAAYLAYFSTNYWLHGWEIGP